MKFSIRLVLIILMVLFAFANPAHLATSKKPQTPKDASSRLQLAKKLVARIDKLSEDEQALLGQLGDQAFQAALPLAKKRLQAYESLELARKDSTNAFRKFSLVMRAILKRCVNC